MIIDTCRYENIINNKSLQSQKYQLIETPEECSKIVENLLIDQKIIAIDCEGVFLSREGKLTLIQVIYSMNYKRIFSKFIWKTLMNIYKIKMRNYKLLLQFNFLIFSAIKFY